MNNNRKKKTQTQTPGEERLKSFLDRSVFQQRGQTFAERPFRAVCETEYGIPPFVEYGQE